MTAKRRHGRTTPTPAAPQRRRPGQATRPVPELSLHPDASLVPEMTSDEYDGFLADVAERGIIDPIHVTSEGVVVDGRHRYRAAVDLGLERVAVRVVDPGDAVEYMIRSAVARRQLSGSQRAALVVELEAYAAARDAGLAKRRANLRNVEPEALPVGGGPATLSHAAIRLAGVSDRTLRDAALVHRHDPALFAQVKAGGLAVQPAANRVRRALRDNGLATPPLPSGAYDVILADPPWASQNPDSDWAPERHYPTMPVADICALQVPAAEAAILYLWAVAAQLPDALRVVEAWGFSYTGEIIWAKPAPPGLGTWVRYQHESLLIATRGAVSPPQPDHRFSSLVEAPRGKHSAKPVVIHELIERAHPHASRLELFARTQRAGWTAWGNQLPAKDAGEEAA